MLKADLRKKYKNLRSHLSVNKIDEMSLAISHQILKIDIWEYFYFHLFLSIKEQKEINTNPIIDLLFSKKREVIISKFNFRTIKMIPYLLTKNTRFETNNYKIPEPISGFEFPENEINIIFIPLLAYDKKGNRVGYGKGFYDLFLKKINCIKIGLSFFEPEENIEDIKPHDVTLNYCVTPKKIYKF